MMAPGTNTGAAHPLMAIGGFPVDGGEAAKTLTQKITSNATAFLRSIASKRNRNVAEAEKGVTESKSFTDAEALEKNLIDMVAKDETELLRRLDGYKVHMFSGRERTLRVRDQPVADYEMTTRQKFLSTISQPNLALLLGLAGLILLFLCTLAAAVVQYGDHIYFSDDGVMYENRVLSWLGKPGRWLRWEDVVEIREIKRKILVLLSADGRRVLVDAILGYAIARNEILRRAPHAVVSGTLARDDV